MNANHLKTNDSKKNEDFKKKRQGCKEMETGYEKVDVKPDALSFLQKKIITFKNLIKNLFFKRFFC